jgi:hypothetical protein
MDSIRDPDGGQRTDRLPKTDPGQGPDTRRDAERGRRADSGQGAERDQLAERSERTDRSQRTERGQGSERTQRSDRDQYREPDRGGEEGGRVVAQRLLALLGGILIAIGIVGLMVFPARDDADPVRPRALLPTPAAPALADPSPSPAGRKTAVAGTRKPKGSPAGKASTRVSAVPDVARTGPIVAASGRCLALDGVVDGSLIVTARCSGDAAQRFTLATDGTLRVSGWCAEATENDTVRVIDCDERASAQWRAASRGSLVNPAGGHCLTDPGQAGAAAYAATCTGGSRQRWHLP